MALYGTHFWKKAPFVKLLLGLMAGILLQWRFQLPINTWLIVMVTSSVALLGFFFLPFFKRYKLSFLSGITAGIVFVAAGALLAHRKDIRNNNRWLGNYYKEKNGVVVTLNEPLAEKTKSYKANATVSYLLQDGKAIPVKGNIIIYFKKDSALRGLEYGSQLLFKKSLQEIKNSGNPGGFDYNRYCLFQASPTRFFCN
ncbi:MAG: ComEC/Rec2 family competence protein, partial [Bacteroidota bacterium]